MQVLPANPVLGVKPVAVKALPPNPVGATLGGTAAPMAAKPVSNDLTGIATHIATGTNFSPDFVKALQDMQQHDPTFQTRLNAEIDRVSKNIEAKRNSGPLAIAGNAIEQAANPLEWVKTAIDSAPQLTHGVGKVAHGNVGGGLKQAGLGAVGVAGILPVGRLGKVGEALGVALKGRTAEEAAQHVAEAARTAKTEGHGALGSGGRGNAPLLKPGETTPETGGELGKQVRDALKEAPAARNKQEALYTEERGLRSSAAEQAMKMGGEKGYLEALHQLHGELPKEFFGGMKHFTQPQFEALLTHVQQHPALRTFEKVSTMDAIKKAVADGIVPTKSDQALLERAFGKEAQPIGEALKTAAYWKQFGVDLLNVPRAVMASTDLSAPLRQGLVYGVSHPVMFAKTFVPMLKSAVKEGYFQQMIQDEIHDRPTFPLMEKAKVAFTDIGKDAKHGAEALGQREEARMSNLAERIPIWGRVIRGSDRAYVGFLNKARADYFDRLIHDAAKQGLDVNDEHLLQSIGKVINTATGRGNVPKVLADHLATMNAFFFSPRLLASRVNMLNPLYYAKLDPFARREALRNIAALGGTALTVLSLAKMAGAKVNDDPRNADFGKIKIGNTRLDILGGFQQPIRLGAQLYTGTIISSTTGKKIALAGGFAHTSRYDVVMRFLQSKASPVPSVVVDLLKGQTFGGQKITAQNEIVQRVTPLLAQDIWDLYHTPGAGGLKTIPEAGLGVLGVGLQSYAPKAPKPSSGGGGTGFGDTGTGFGDGGSTGFDDNSTGFGG